MKSKQKLLFRGILVLLLIFIIAKNNVKASTISVDSVQDEVLQAKEPLGEQANDELNILLSMNEEEQRNYINNESYCGVANSSAATVITSPISYLHKNVGKPTDTYTVTSKIISGVSNATCSQFNDNNNCTIVALYNLMVYYRSRGYSKISSSKSGLYKKIMKEAKSLGYTQSSGLGVTKNNNLVTNTWKSFGYSSGKGCTTYLWTKGTAIDNIDNKKPFIFSLATGYYYNHSIAVYGYKTYKNKRNGKKYKFLVVSDGWTTAKRYMAWSNTGEGYIGAITTINKP